MATSHPAVRVRAVSDCVPEKKGGAQFSAPDYEQVIRHPEVGAVIVSTSEDQHADAAVCAPELGIPVLVEKPSQCGSKTPTA